MSEFEKNIENYLSEFGILVEQIEKDPIIIVKQWIVKEYQKAPDKFVKGREIDAKINWALAENAKLQMSIQQFAYAKQLFELSIHLCQRNDWPDGIRYAKEMINKCDEILKHQLEAQEQTKHDLQTEKAKIEEEEKKKVEETKIKSEKPAPPKTEHEKIAKKITESKISTSEKTPLPPPILVQKGKGRLTCPKCGNTNTYMFRETEDFEHKIMDYPLVFGKKYYCGQCGTCWRREESQES
jgi:predicted nucleic-acid-binding Zn-ribbon protein